MKRLMLTLFAPPVAVCRFGCAGCCAAPITVFWLAGLLSTGYGLAGGPTGMAGPSWHTVGLGAILWSVAVLWTALAIRGGDSESCAGGNSSVCAGVLQHDGDEESQPLEQARRLR